MTEPKKCPRCKTDETDCPVAGMADKTYTPQEYCLADIACSLRALITREYGK